MKKYTSARPRIPLPFLALAIGAMLVVVGVVATTRPAPTSQAAQAPIRHVIEASYAHVYPTMASMMPDAAFILEGTVTGVKRVGDLSGAPRVETDFTVRVNRVLFDRHATGLRTGQTVTVRTLGGTLSDGTVWEDGDAPAVHVGQHTLFFLSRGDMAAGAANTSLAPYYWTLNGGTGRFQITASGTVQQSDDKSITLSTAMSIGALATQMQTASTK